MPPKYIRNTNKTWTSADHAALRDLAARNTPTRVIGLKIGRSEDAVRSKASGLKVSLAPTNQAPHNRRSSR